MNVSVIIPAYNAAETIADTLESLLAQTHSNWEAIVVDDGSNDETAEVTKNFIERDARIRMIKQPNGGEGAARNAGIAQARYDWLLFLDADDWILPLHLERLTYELVSNPELDAVHCLSARVACDGTLISEKYLPPDGDMFSTLARRAAFPIHACIVRKSLVEVVGNFDTSLRTSPDWDLWQRIARTGARFGAVREVLALYRMRPTSASLEAYQLFNDGLCVLKRGHSPDPRVKNPHPDHANGLPQEQIRNQEFYLLSWCAGLLLGSGKDVCPLLEIVKEDNYPELYPDAVAQCVFEAATLPICRPPHAWEDLWPSIRQHIENFFVALEKQSMAPELAHRAITALKKMILRHSSSWRPIIEEHEQTIEKQKARIGELEQGKMLIEKERNYLLQVEKQHLQTIESQKAHIEELKHSKVLIEKERNDLQLLKKEHEQTIGKLLALIEELKQGKMLMEQQISNWQQLAEERESIITKLQEKLWVRLGLRLGILKQHNIANLERNQGGDH
jgi:glycosyltransferase involved in cell wall biosynthesis